LNKRAEERINQISEKGQVIERKKQAMAESKRRAFQTAEKIETLQDWIERMPKEDNHSTLTPTSKRLIEDIKAVLQAALLQGSIAPRKHCSKKHCSKKKTKTSSSNNNNNSTWSGNWKRRTGIGMLR
jgi:hypothetical protein